MIEEQRAAANRRAQAALEEADPHFVDILPASECVIGMGKRMILHSGPPLAFEKMTFLHQRGVLNGAILEGWAKDEAEARRLIADGEIELDSALNYNTVGSGTGIITPSVALLVVEDKKTGKRAGVFPSEGKFGGGFCGWGIYSPEIRENLRWMRDELFQPLRPLLAQSGGIALAPIIAESLTMGDENHSRQTAADLLFLREFVKLIVPSGLSEPEKNALLTYFAETPRFFHNLGQAASKCALLSAEDIPFSTMVVAAGGNGVEYGIRISAFGKRWFTAPSPMIEGTYMTEGARRENQLPWIGDSSIVECAGLGGIATACSPLVASWRGESPEQANQTTREMRKICIASRSDYRIPNLGNEPLPSGIDALAVDRTGILPVIDGGMIGRDGGWMGAGCARIPAKCFADFADAYRIAYGD